MSLKQVFKTYEGACKRAAFENAHRQQRRDNVNFRFFVVRCRDGKPDGAAFDRAVKYDYRIERTLSDHATRYA